MAVAHEFDTLAPTPPAHVRFGIAGGMA